MSACECLLNLPLKMIPRQQKTRAITNITNNFSYKPVNANQMRVRLGVPSLKAFVVAPKAFKVIGVVRFGMEYGLLATNAAGLYFRVNGSLVMELDPCEVHRAIDFSYGFRFHECCVADIND